MQQGSQNQQPQVSPPPNQQIFLTRPSDSDPGSQSGMLYTEVLKLYISLFLYSSSLCDDPTSQQCRDTAGHGTRQAHSSQDIIRLLSPDYESSPRRIHIGCVS